MLHGASSVINNRGCPTVVRSKDFDSMKAFEFHLRNITFASKPLFYFNTQSFFLGGGGGL